MDNKELAGADPAFVPSAMPTPSSPTVSTEGFNQGESLVAEIEAANGPTYLLDAAIHNLVEPESRWSSMETFGASGGYTHSLDTAMTLVPEGWNWMAGNRNLPIARAYVENGELFYTGMASRKNPRKQWFECVAATPALALCAAALKARASQAGTRPEGQDAQQGLGLPSGGGPLADAPNSIATPLGDVS